MFIGTILVGIQLIWNNKYNENTRIPVYKNACLGALLIIQIKLSDYINSLLLHGKVLAKELYPHTTCTDSSPMKERKIICK